MVALLPVRILAFPGVSGNFNPAGRQIGGAVGSFSGRSRSSFTKA